MNARTPRDGKVLCQFSWGHLFDVVGDRAVVMDGFGPMTNRESFEAATSIFLSTREESVAAYCEN